jgi:hypothetical protein
MTARKSRAARKSRKFAVSFWVEVDASIPHDKADAEAFVEEMVAAIWDSASTAQRESWRHRLLHVRSPGVADARG